jgi:glutamine synthetase
MSKKELASLGLVRLPENLKTALAALAADKTVCGWFAPVFIETFIGEKRAELAHLKDRTPATICELYRALY